MVGHQAGGVAEGQLDQSVRHLTGVDRLELEPAATGIAGSLASCRAVSSDRVWNWVARSVVQGRPEPATSGSAASLDAK